MLLESIQGGKARGLGTGGIGTVAQEFLVLVPPQDNVLSIWKSQTALLNTLFVMIDVQILFSETRATTITCNTHDGGG